MIYPVGERVVGRDAELAEVARLLADDRPVVVVGEAGIGKTTLLRAAALASRRHVAEGGALSTLSWMQYLPFERAFGVAMTDGDPIAVASAIERRVGSGVLLLDDLQWADAATVEATTLLAGRIGLLAGVRRGDGSAQTVIDQLRAAGFVEIAPAPLNSQDASAVVRSLRPDLSAAMVGRVVERTGGNPLLLRELTVSGEPTASLRLSIAARLRKLDAAGRNAFGMLAVAGHPLRHDELDEAGVKSLLDADLVITGTNGIDVRHALLAEVLVGELEPPESAQLHLALAHVVADDGEAARHWQLGGDRARAYEAAMRAATQTVRPGEEAAHLGIAAACATGPDADALRLRAAHALERAHDWDGMTAVLDLLATADGPTRAEACLLRARSAWTAGDEDGLRRWLDEGLALVRGTGSDVEVRLLIEATRVPIFIEGDLTRAVAASENALTLARGTGVDLARAEYLHGTALLVAQRPGGAEHLRAAIAAARDATDINTEFLAANNLIADFESTDDPAAGRAVCDEFIARAGELGLGEWALSFRTVRAGLDFHAGNYGAVLAVAEDLLDQVRERRGRDNMIEVLCVTLIDVGRIEEAIRWLERLPLADDHRGRIQGAWVRAEAALWSGRPAEVVQLADTHLTPADSDPNLELFKVARAWASWDLGRDPGPLPEPHAYPMLAAVRPEVQGIAELVTGRDARRSFEDAAALWTGFHYRGELRCRWALGEAERRAGDPARAIQLLEDVEQAARAKDMSPLVARVHRSLRAAGVRRSAPRTRTSGDLLTGRQRELLRLVGAGHTNAEIAQRLGISRHTVVSQLGSAVTKLGATGRTHAAVLAGER